MKFKRRLIIRAKRKRRTKKLVVPGTCFHPTAGLVTGGCIRGNGKLEMSVLKLGGRSHSTKTINRVRYRGAAKTARTKVQAEEAEGAILLTVHSGT